MNSLNSNPYAYRGYQHKSLVRILLLLVVSVITATLLGKFIGDMALIPAAMLFFLGALRINSEPLLMILWRLISFYISGRAGDLKIRISAVKRGDNYFYTYRGKLYLPLKLIAPRRVGATSSERKLQCDIIEEILKRIECGFSVISTPITSTRVTSYEGNKSTGDYFEMKRRIEEGSVSNASFIVLEARNTTEDAILSLSASAEKIREVSRGIRIEPASLEDLFGYILPAKPSSPQLYIPCRCGRKYFKLGVHYYMGIEITDYGSGNAGYLSQEIDSLNFPCYVLFHGNVLPKNRAERILRSMIAERSSDLKLGGLPDTGRKQATRQLHELRKISSSLETAGVPLIKGSLTILISADSPIELSRRYRRISAALEFMGFRIKVTEYLNRKKIERLMPLGDSGYPYISSSENLSCILPGFFEPADSVGILIGLNGVTGKGEYLSPFSGHSFNMLVVGETGSGKTHLVKLIARRGIQAGVFRRVLIIDPLHEYDPDYFPGNTGIIDLSAGDYPVLPDSASSDLLNNLTSLLKRILDLDPDDYNHIQSLVASFISSGVRDIRDILLGLKQKSGLYGDLIDYAISNYFIRPVNLDPGQDLTVVRLSSGDSISREIQLLQIASFSYEWMSSGGDAKAIIVDEAHLFLDQGQTVRVMDQMVRNSRHFGTSIINVTQNFSDFRRSTYSLSMINNSAEIFLFRNKLDSDELSALFGDLIPGNAFLRGLRGGKGASYSECVRISGSRSYPVKIISTPQELS